MTCTIYLIRHGIAGPATPQVSDSDRALTADGARKFTRAVVGLKAIGVVPDAVLSSPLRRAQETAVLVGNGIVPDAPVEIYPALAPGHPPEEVAKGLRAYRGARQLVLVGHQPDLGELASYLLTGSSGLVPLPFKKGAVAAIEVSALPPRSAGALRWFLTSKQLRWIGRGRRRSAKLR